MMFLAAACGGLGLTGCATAAPKPAQAQPAAAQTTPGGGAWERYRDEGAAGQGCKVEPDAEAEAAPAEPTAKCKRELPPEAP